MNKKIDPEIRKQIDQILDAFKLHLLTEVELNGGLFALEKDIAQVLQEMKDEIERLKDTVSIKEFWVTDSQKERLMTNYEEQIRELKKTIARLGRALERVKNHEILLSDGKGVNYQKNFRTATEALTPEVKKIMEETQNDN